jgi:hypothetical protein
MKNGQDLTDADIERSQAFLGAVLGMDEEGNPSPDRLQPGANNPPEPILDEKAAAAKAAAERSAEDKRVADLIANATEWAKEYPKIETEEVAVAATDWLDQLDKDWDKIEAKRVAERAPLNERLKAIQAEYTPWLTRISICREAIRGPHSAYKLLAEQQRKAREAAAKRAAEEAQRRADQLEEQAKAGGPNVIAATILAREATQEADQARKVAAAVPKRTQIRGNLGGRTHSLRTVWMVDIHEIEKTFERYKGRREVKELLHSLALADVRNPRLWRNPEERHIPGCHTYSEQV